MMVTITDAGPTAVTDLPLDDLSVDALFTDGVLVYLLMAHLWTIDLLMI